MSFGNNTNKLNWTLGLVILLIFQIILAALIILYSIIDFSTLIQQFGLKYHPEMRIFQLMLIYCFTLSGSICSLSLIWIRSYNIAGIQAGILVGFLLFVLGIAFFVLLNRLDLFIFDSIRGLLMVVFGIMSYRNYLKIVN